MRLRQPLAAVLGVAGLVIGAVAAVSAPASAAGELTGPVTFNCQLGGFPAYTWNSTVTLTALRPAGSTTVTVTAHTSDMVYDTNVALDYDVTNSMTLELAGAPVTLNGSGHVTAAPAADFPLPNTQGTFTSSAATVTAKVTGYSFLIAGMTGTCTPTGGADLGTLTIVEGVAPIVTPTPKPTTTTSATATPTPKPKPSGKPKPTSGAAAGKPAKGDVDFACVLNPLGTKFDYPATLTVSGYREKAGDDISLSAKISDLPGISPVPIDGQMDVTLDLVVDKKKTTLKGSEHATAPPKAEVPVPTMSGSVASDADEVDVAVNGFTFDFAALAIDAQCEADAVALSKLAVGSEPVEDDSDGGTDSSSGGGAVSGGGGSLPQTGGGDAIPVVALWALALTLLGAAVLLCVPTVTRRKA